MYCNCGSEELDSQAYRIVGELVHRPAPRKCGLRPNQEATINMMDLMPCCCGDTNILKNRVELVHGVVHRTSAPCYVYNMDGLEEEAKSRRQAEVVLKKRMEAWVTASHLVDPVIERHGIEAYTLGQAFSTTSKVTAVEQHFDIITRLAEWLLEKEL